MFKSATNRKANSLVSKKKVYKMNKIWTWRTTAVAAFAGDADTTLHSASTTYIHLDRIVTQRNFHVSCTNMHNDKKKKTNGSNTIQCSKLHIVSCIQVTLICTFRLPLYSISVSCNKICLNWRSQEYHCISISVSYINICINWWSQEHLSISISISLPLYLILIFV